MNHTEIQQQLLRYLDGDLPDEKMRQIREHLSTCPICAERHTVLASIWLSESRLEKMKPSPFLWTRLQARIKEYEQTPALFRDLKNILQGIHVHPFPALAVIAAIVVGIYIGTPRESQKYDLRQPANQSSAAAEDLGLDQFDVIPPSALGTTLVQIFNTQK